MKKNFSVVSLVGAILCLYSVSCGNGRGQETGQKEQTNSFPPHVIENAQYNLYVEKSASMRGYFGQETAKNILKEYIDRLSENENFIDTITFNFIDGKIITQSKLGIKPFVNSIYQNCNASHSKIDDILEKIMSLTDSKTVNLLVSDFIFDNPDASLPMAQSGITKIFTSFLKQNSDLSIAIVKYDAEFKGLYFPPTGSLNCAQNRPLYIWAFGPSEHIKEFVNLKTKQTKEDLFLLQPSIEIPYQFDKTGKSARMFSVDNSGCNRSSKDIQNKDNCIVVSNWDKERRSDFYEITLYADFSECVLSKSDITETANYTITPSQYSIKSITHIEDNKYKFIINTKKPSPCDIKIQYALNLPDWIETSNYEGNNIPPQGQTYGIKYLFGGVFDAYNNQFHNLFEINLKLK